MGKSKELFTEMREHDMQWGKPYEPGLYPEEGEFPRDFWNYCVNPITGYTVRRDEMPDRQHNEEANEMERKAKAWNEYYRNRRK